MRYRDPVAAAGSTLDPAAFDDWTAFQRSGTHGGGPSFLHRAAAVLLPFGAVAVAEHENAPDVLFSRG